MIRFIGLVRWRLNRILLDFMLLDSLDTIVEEISQRLSHAYQHDRHLNQVEEYDKRPAQFIPGGLAYINVFDNVGPNDDTSER